MTTFAQKSPVEQPLQVPPQAPEDIGGFGYWNKEQEDSVRRIFISNSGYRHAFGNFYRNSSGRWALLKYRFGIPEGAKNIFAFYECPPLDKASFRELSWCYWSDKNGVYCDLTGVLHIPRIFRVNNASPRSFRPIDCATLAIDGQKVFLEGTLLPHLRTESLRIFTEDGECPSINVFDGIYLISKATVYEYDKRLLGKSARNFRVPKGYCQAYPRDKNTNKSDTRK